MGQNDNPYNRSGMVIFLLSMVGSLLFFVYIAFIHPGVVGIDTIKEPEVGADGQVIAEIEAADPDAVEKPWVATPEMVQAGKEVYNVTCASCHGKKGLGDGPAATPTTRNLVEGSWKQGKGSAIDLYKTLQTGVPGTPMVSFKGTLSPGKRWAVVHYVRSLTQNKIDDEATQLETFAKSAD